MVIYTSPHGDILVFDPQHRDARIVFHEHVARYHANPASAPAYRIGSGLHLATLSLGYEMGLSFQLVPTALLPGLQPPAPVLSLWLARKLKALLVQADIPIAQCRQLFCADDELSLVVGLSYVIPRTRWQERTAVELMHKPFKDRMPNGSRGGASS